LYKKLLHKSEFGLAHCEEWFKISPKKLFCNFWTFLQVSMNLGSLKQFLEFKTIEKRFKIAAQCSIEIGPWLQCTARRPAMHGRPEGRLGHGLAAQSSHGCGPRAACAPAWSQRVGRARGGAVAHSPVARWWLAGGKVLV
jgi:hypothetical protein